MKLLMQVYSNALTRIKYINKITTDIVLTESKQAASKVKADTIKDLPPTFTTCTDAKEEADTQNYAIQDTMGTKQGTSDIVGMKVTDQVLHNNDGILKGVNKFLLSEVF